MKRVKTTLASIRTGGRTYDLVWTKLDRASLKIYRRKHEQPSRFYELTRWEYAIEFGKRKLSIHYKRDL